MSPKLPFLATLGAYWNPLPGLAWLGGLCCTDLALCMGGRPRNPLSRFASATFLQATLLLLLLADCPIAFTVWNVRRDTLSSRPEVCREPRGLCGRPPASPLSVATLTFRCLETNWKVR